MKTTPKVLRLIRLFLNEILQISKFKFFVFGDKFCRIEKFFEKIVEKLVRLLSGEVEKLAYLLAHLNAMLKNWHAFGSLARWQVSK